MAYDYIKYDLKCYLLKGFVGLTATYVVSWEMYIPLINMYNLCEVHTFDIQTTVVFYLT